MSIFNLNKKAMKGMVIGLATLTAFSFIKSSNKKVEPTNSNDSSITTNTQQDYINTLKSNEFKVYDEDLNTLPIQIKNYDHMIYMDNLNNYDSEFKWAKYYGLEEALEIYNASIVNKSTDSTLLDSNGKLDPNKLIEQTKKNNEAYMSQGKNTINTFYSTIKEDDMKMICDIITEIVNSNFNGIEINEMANTLMELKMFEHSGSAANAYITDNITFVYNPNMSSMYAEMQKIQGTANNKTETLKSIITHEVMHLLQHSRNDNIEENGIESGICRKYNIPNQEKNIPVDCLWNTWLLEAGAELGMSEYLNTKPGTYAKKISYVKSYNLSRFNDINIKDNGLEKAVFNQNVDEAFKDLNLSTQEEQREFLEFLYSVEIIQSDPEEFWNNYTNITGENPSEEEKLEIRTEIRKEAVKYMTKNFYRNLIDAINEEKVTDLDTANYLIRNWELDIFNHIEYTNTNTLEDSEDFIIWHNEIQNETFKAIANSNNLTYEEVKAEYQEYNLQASIDNKIYDNCDLSKFNQYTKDYILESKNSYRTTNFSRNEVVMDHILINSNIKSTENFESYSTK